MLPWFPKLALAMTSAVESLAGTLLGLFCFALLLYGSATSQMYNYWLNYINDTKLHRRTVAVVWLVDTIHTVFCLIVIYRYIIIDFGQLELLQYIVWPITVTVGTEVLLSAIVQSFYIRHVWMSSRKNKGLCGCIGALLFARITFGFATVGLIFERTTYAQFNTEEGSFATLTCSLGLGAAVDLLVAVSLIFYRLKTPRRASESMHVVELIQSYVINTGALTMLVSLSIMFTFAFLKENLAFAGLIQIQAKLYANSFIATMSERAEIHAEASEIISTERAGRAPALQPRKRPLPGIKVADEDLFASGIPTTGSAGTSIAHDNETDAEPIEKTTRFLSMENDKKVDVELGKETQVFL